MAFHAGSLRSHVEAHPTEGRLAPSIGDLVALPCEALDLAEVVSPQPEAYQPCEREHGGVRVIRVETQGEALFVELAGSRPVPALERLIPLLGEAGCLLAKLARVFAM